MIKRSGKTSLSPGMRQVVISGLPPILQDQSVRISASGTAVAKIVEVKVDRMFLDTLMTARVKPLLQKSKNMNLEMRKLNDRLSVLKHQGEFLDKIGIASQESIARDLKSTRPTVEDYKKLMSFFDTELSGVKTETRSLEDQRLELQQAYERLQKEIQEIGGSPEKSEKQITVIFDVNTGGSLTIEASYLVPQASWTPVYDIRVASADTTVSLTYSAFVKQNTGEDWKDASVTLTTSRPALGGTPPELLPWFIGAADRATGMVEGTVRDASTGEPLPGATVTIVGLNFSMTTDANGIYRISNVRPGANSIRATCVGYTSVRSSVFTRPFASSTMDFSLPESSIETGEIVVTEERPLIQKNTTSAIAAGEVDIRGGVVPPTPIAAQTATVSTTVTAASFEIPGQTTIPSDNASHRVTVMTTNLGGTFSHTSIPKMQADVYFKAKLKNSTDFPILAGPMSVYLDNNFVSNSKLKAILPAESFDAYLGVDNGVRVERKLLNRLTETSGLFSKTRKILYDILIVAENLKKASQALSIQENIPVSQDERVKVTISKPKPEEILPDANGTITWQLTLTPGERREIKLQYSIESPIELNVGGLD
jgi:hypothetical protein